MTSSPAEIVTVQTPLLSIACEVSGPRDGAPTVLVHGWPDDVRTWDRLLSPLHAAGRRTIVPYLRGCGPTRFREPSTMRSGQFAALADDLFELAKAMKLERFALVGHDWGARAAYIASALRPDVVTHCAALSVGWGTNDPDQPLSMQQIHNYWYHWYMALERGAARLEAEREEFTRYIWTIWNPNRRVPDDEFAVTAASFDNPDWTAVVVHSYRVRWALAERDPRYAEIEARVRASPEIEVPTLVIHGGSDTVNDPATSEGREAMFSGEYERIVLERSGHFPQRDDPNTVGSLLAAFLNAPVGASPSEGSP